MKLEKLTIQYEQMKAGQFTGSLQALFNPNALSYSRQVTWQPVNPAESSSTLGLRYETRAPEILTLGLFFDTYEHPSTSVAVVSPATRPPSVVPYTEQITQLAAIERELHRPPICKLRWGKTLLFSGVLTSVSRRYVLFLDDGTPVRATMECTFTEYEVDTGTANELHSADVSRKYTVQPGDTLTLIASQLYGDMSLWRKIAEANELERPLDLTPGRTLVIPKIR